MAGKHEIEFRVVEAASWGLSTDPDGKDARAFSGGTPDAKTHVESFSAKELPLLAGAEAAGVIEIVKASRETRSALSGHVESQADSEKAYTAAQEAGTWHEGNLRQFLVDTPYRLAALHALDEDLRAPSHDGVVAWLKAGVEDASRILKRMEDGHPYDRAVRLALAERDLARITADRDALGDDHANREAFDHSVRLATARLREIERES